MATLEVPRSSLERTDARPIIPRNDTNLWTKAEGVRDQLYDLLVEACQRHGLDALLLRSGPSVFPAWVKFEAWKPQEDNATTERSSALITIEPKPYHTVEFELTVTYTVKKRTRTVQRVVPFGEEQVRALVDHLVGDGRAPRFDRFREAPFQLWRINNKVEGLRGDVMAVLMAVCIVLGFLLMALPPVGLLLWGSAAYIYVRMRKRRWIVRNDGKPDGEPRSLIRVDSWQTVLFGLGKDSAVVRDRFVSALKTGSNRRCQFRSERVWYWGLDGKEEREQWVLTAGRGLVFCQIYGFGQDLYVGWDGHLNRGQWVEQTVASGIDKASGDPVGISRVVPGTQPLSEFDLADLSCLMEWTHAQMVKLLKQLIAENMIDQEIDFSIQRAERQQVVASGAAAEGGIGKKVRKVFQRTA